MTILVTGGAGYIGSHLVHELVDAGETVVVFDDLSSGFSRFLPQQVPLVVGDCGNTALVAETIVKHRVEAIFHFAGSTIIPESIERPLHYYRNNTLNTCAVIEAAVDRGVRHLVFSSSAAVYGNPPQMPVAEDAPTVPQSPYGRSKLMAEQMLTDAGSRYGLGHVALRYFNVAGADPGLRTGQSTPAATHLIKVAVQTALGLRPSMSVFGNRYPTPDGTCVRDFIHVTDLARAHVDALRYLRQGGASQVFNCGYGHGTSVFEVIDAVRRVSGAAVPAEVAPPRNGDLPIVIASADRVRAMLGWRPRFDDIDLVVAHALAWEKKLSGLGEVRPG